MFPSGALQSAGRSGNLFSVVSETHPCGGMSLVIDDLIGSPLLPSANGKGSPAFLGTGCLHGSHPKTSLNTPNDGQLEGDTSPGQSARGK